jgi:hypothetical protein
MDLFNINNFEFVNEDPDVLMRVKNPASDTEITFLTSDGKTMGEDELYRVDNMGDQWFVVINNPLLQDKINKSVEQNSEEYGTHLSRFLPLSFIFQSALTEIVEASEQQGEQE